MVKLYEIAEEIRLIERMLDEADVDEESFEKALEGLNIERDAKISNIGLLVKEIKADIDARKTLINELKQQNTYADNRIGRLKEYVNAHLEDKVKTPLVSVYRQKAQERLVLDGDVPERFYRKEVSRSAVIEALKNGEDVPNARMERGDPYLVIR